MSKKKKVRRKPLLLLRRAAIPQTNWSLYLGGHGSTYLIFKSLEQIPRLSVFSLKLALPLWKKLVKAATFGLTSRNLSLFSNLRGPTSTSGSASRTPLFLNLLLKASQPQTRLCQPRPSSNGPFQRRPLTTSASSAPSLSKLWPASTTLCSRLIWKSKQRLQFRRRNQMPATRRGRKSFSTK